MNRVETTVRWMVAGDLPAVLEIERASFDEPLDEAGLRALIEGPRRVGLVATLGAPPALSHPWSRCFGTSAVVGYLVQRFGLGEVSILRLAVARGHRGRGVGESLARAIQAKVSVRRPRVVMEVSDRNLQAQLWLRAIGWRAVAVQGENYLFQWPPAGVPAWAWEDQP